MHKPFQLLLFLVILFNLSYSLSDLVPVLDLGSVADSGDSYPSTLPIPGPGLPFAGKKVLFAISHGVEDHEVYYVHQYYSVRGAEIVFGCPSPGRVALSDFTKPSYLVNCTYNLMESTDILQFDAVYIAGGLPSSTAVRNTLKFTTAVRSFFDLGGSDRILTIICSGNEILIETGILEVPIFLSVSFCFQSGQSQTTCGPPPPPFLSFSSFDFPLFLRSSVLSESFLFIVEKLFDLL